MAAVSVSARTPRGQGDMLRERLLQAGVDLVCESGDPAGLSIRAVTRHAGVSPTALYLHFDNRDDYMRALLARGFAEFRAALGRAAGGATGPGERLRQAGLAYIAFARELPAVYDLIFGSGSALTLEGPKPPEADAAFDDLLALVADYIGPERASREDLLGLARGVWTGMHGYVTLRRARPNVDWGDERHYAEALSQAWLGDPGV